MQHITQPPEEGLVNVFNEISGEDNDPRVPLHVVQEYTHIHIGIAISG